PSSGRATHCSQPMVNGAEACSITLLQEAATAQMSALSPIDRFPCLAYLTDMAKLPIITLPDPLLRQVSEPVERIDDELRQLADDMLETMYVAPGVGLAAVQV